MSKLEKLQTQFSHYLRDPHKIPQEITDPRISLYRELTYNNIDRLLRDSFPIFHSICKQVQWQQLIKDFYQTHFSKSPLFSELPLEFLSYLETKPLLLTHHEFFYELAHFEWVEFALFIAPEPVLNLAIDPNGDLFHGQPILTELAWNLIYKYRVHKITEKTQPPQFSQEITYLLALRNAEGELNIIETNALTYSLLQLLKQPLSGKQALLKIAEQMAHPQPQKLLAIGQDALQQLRESGAILGSATF